MAAPRNRAERALVTRRRMVSAGYLLFCEKGYLGTTMNAIAAEAGVAVQTLYYTFHAKAEILGEALGAAIVGFDNWFGPPPGPIMVERLLPMHTWWDEFEAALDARAALAVFIDNGVGVLERVGPLVAAMHGGSGDPDAEAVIRVGEERRVESYRAVVEVVAAKPGGLRPGLDVEGATDLLVVLFSAEVYQAFANGRGWSRARCARFFHEVLPQQLVG
ncbi:MAG TPA: TetR/AcrR family transcriptional regulator [Aldersonia sp.]